MRKQKRLDRYYRGTVDRVYDDRFILKFRKDFIQDFAKGEIYEGEFFYSRTIFARKHAAIDYAKMKMPEPFLFPKKMCVAETLQLNVELKDGKLMLEDNEIPWFKSSLNKEQKQAVADSLKGECRPYPYIIFGPPVSKISIHFKIVSHKRMDDKISWIKIMFSSQGTGKTSTVIEIILQVFTHVEGSKILVATQSNTAANVVASQLVREYPEISKCMVRLVSNAVLDRKTLPDELHKYSASIRNKNIDENVVHDIDGGINKNCELDYIKDFTIVIGTCVGLGIMFGR